MHHHPLCTVKASASHRLMGCLVVSSTLGTAVCLSAWAVGAGESGVDQLVEIIKVLGTPTREEIHAMNPNYTEFKFPQIKAHPWTRVFNKRMPADGVDLASPRPASPLALIQACMAGMTLINGCAPDLPGASRPLSRLAHDCRCRSCSNMRLIRGTQPWRPWLIHSLTSSETRRTSSPMVSRPVTGPPLSAVSVKLALQ